MRYWLVDDAELAVARGQAGPFLVTGGLSIHHRSSRWTTRLLVERDRPRPVRGSAEVGRICADLDEEEEVGAFRDRFLAETVHPYGL